MARVRGETYDSDGDTENTDVDDCQRCLAPVLEVLTLVHVEPKDGGEPNCLIQISTLLDLHCYVKSYS